MSTTSSSTVSLSWKASNQNVGGWIIYINDVAIARLSSERTSVNINDLDLESDIVFSIATLGTDLRLGEAAKVVLSKGLTVIQSASATPSNAVNDALLANSRPTFSASLPLPAVLNIPRQFTATGDPINPSTFSPVLLVGLGVVGAFTGYVLIRLLQAKKT